MSEAQQLDLINRNLVKAYNNTTKRIEALNKLLTDIQSQISKLPTTQAPTPEVSPVAPTSTQP